MNNFLDIEFVVFSCFDYVESEFIMYSASSVVYYVVAAIGS
nr:MAG TPA: hypothetical protein [Crassvirales sp.]